VHWFKVLEFKVEGLEVGSWGFAVRTLMHMQLLYPANTQLRDASISSIHII